MGIPESPYSRDFGDPVVIIGIPFSRRLAVRYGSTLTVRVQFSRRVKYKMSKYKVAKSGGERISLYEIQNGRSIREKSRTASGGVLRSKSPPGHFTSKYIASRGHFTSK